MKNVFHLTCLTQVRSPPSDYDFTRQNFKNVAVNSLEVVRPFKSCKWNTHFHRKVSNGKTGVPLQKFHLFRKFSSGTNQKRVFHLHPNRNFRFFVGKWQTSRMFFRKIIFSGLSSGFPYKSLYCCWLSLTLSLRRLYEHMF